jgi:hypothetical protein
VHHLHDGRITLTCGRKSENRNGMVIIRIG